MECDVGLFCTYESASKKCKALLKEKDKCNDDIPCHLGLICINEKCKKIGTKEKGELAES